MGFVIWIFCGLAVGVIARALLPGRQPMGFALTALVGIVGGFVGGLAAAAWWGHGGPATAFQPVGIAGSVVGAIVLLAIAGAVMAPRRRTV